jgi:hypothetical protein
MAQRFKDRASAAALWILPNFARQAHNLKDAGPLGVTSRVVV